MRGNKCVIVYILVLFLFCRTTSAGEEFINSGWSSYGGTPGGSKFSSLTQINIKNIEHLTEAWTYRSGDVSDGSENILPTALQVTPIFENNLLYLCTPYNRVIALNPETGIESWSFNPEIALNSSNVGVHHCRGVAFWKSNDNSRPAKTCNSRIFLGTGDGRLIAIDANTGSLCEDFGKHGEIDLNHLEKNGRGSIGITSPPAIYQNTVILGSMIPSYERSDSPDGIVWAFDALSGEVKWNWNPLPDELRSQSGGINVWAPISVDTEQGLIFLPTSSPTPDAYGGQRKDPLPYANAIVAVDAVTGVPRWHFQTVHHDLWDYDLPAQPTLVSVQRNGKQVPAVAQVTKTGFVFILNRLTGEPLFPVEEVKVPESDVTGEMSSPTQPYPVLPLPFARQQLHANDAWGLTFWDKGWCRDKISSMRNEGLYTPPSIRGSLQLPSTAGGANWGGAAFDPASGSIVVNVTNVAGYVRLFPREEYEPKPPGAHFHGGLMLGTPYVMEAGPLLSPLGIPCSPPPWGELSAININSGETRWRVPLGRVQMLGPIKSPAAWGSPNIGGAIITAGGLVFIAATMDREFRAYDLNTGQVVWRTSLPAPGMATPMTFSTKTKQQFVVIAAGGHPSYKTKSGDAVVAYTLKQNRK